MTGWEPIQKQLVRDGVNAKYAEPVEGYEGWTQDLVLLRGAAGRDRKARAHQFCNALLDGYFGATLAELRGYIVPNDRGAVYSKAHPEANIGSAVGVSENVRRKLATKVYWQNVRPRNYRLYEQLWNQFRGM